MSFNRKIRSLAKGVLQISSFSIAILLIQNFVGNQYDIPSESMDPTFEVGDRVWLNKLPGNNLNNYERGDIVIFDTTARVNEECRLSVEPNNLYQRVWWQTRAAFGSEPVTREEYTTAFTKRLVGLPGDKLEIKQAQVYLNNEPLAEDYFADVPEKYQDRLYNLPATVVPDGYVVVLGDNRIWSCDSSSWGFLPATQLRGKVTARIWPPSRVTLLETPEYEAQTTAAEE